MIKFRPWGFWITLYSTKNIKIKLLFMKKGKSISIQRHYNRNEIWQCLRGQFLADIDYCANRMFRGDTRLVPIEILHHLHAVTNYPIMLEIQVGQECHEKDIERFDDWPVKVEEKKKEAGNVRKKWRHRK